MAQYWLIGWQLPIVDRVQQMGHRLQASKLGHPHRNVRSPKSHCHNQQCLSKKNGASKKNPVQLNRYIKLTQTSTIEIKKRTIWKNNEIRHGARLRHWIIFNVGARVVRSDSNTGAGSRICRGGEIGGCPPAGLSIS